MGLHYAPLGSSEQLKDQIREAVSDRLVADIPKRVRTKEEFTIRLETAWNRLRPLAEEVGDIAAKSLAPPARARAEAGGRHRPADERRSSRTFAAKWPSWCRRIF